jgi:multidrug efflux system membrane fusion protein
MNIRRPSATHLTDPPPELPQLAGDERRYIETHELHAVLSLIVPLVLFLAIAAVFLSAAGCASPSAQPGEPPPPKVSVAEVAVKDVTEWDEFTGRLEAVNTVSVRPRVSGYVSGVRFHEGAIVNRGDLLFQIDPRPFQAEVDRLKAELTRAKATVQRASSEAQRAERLTAQDAMSREESDRRASFALESNAQVDAVAAALRSAELNLEFTRIAAPISGRVGRAIVTEGNLVSSGPAEGTLMTTVVSLDPIYAIFDVDEAAFLRYGTLATAGRRANVRQTGVPIRMALASDQQFPHEGTLNFLDNQVAPDTGTIRARAVFANPTHALTPGLFVRLRLPGTSAYHGALVRDGAIGTDLDKRYVFVVNKDRTVEYRTVTVGPVLDGLRVVRSGLKPGELVVVNGLQRVRPGMKVDPVSVSMDAPPAASVNGAAASDAPAPAGK